MLFDCFFQTFWGGSVYILAALSADPSAALSADLFADIFADLSAKLLAAFSRDGITRTLCHAGFLILGLYYCLLNLLLCLL